MHLAVIISLLLMFGCHVDAALLADDYHLMPKDTQGVQSLEKVLKLRLAATEAATVCVRLGASSGSGVVVSPDGLVLSAAHVVMGTKRRMEVVFSDGRSYEAHSLGLNADNDAAMLKIVNPPEDLPHVKVWQSSSKAWAPKTTLGSWVFALGHAGGFNAERGAVLRFGRVLRIDEDTLETDCSLIGGDSGGPLFNLEGQLIAIHSRVGRRIVKNMHVPVTAYTRDWAHLLDGELLGDGPYVEPPRVEEIVLGASLYQTKTGVFASCGFAIEGDGRPLLVAGDQVVSCGQIEVKNLAILRDYLNGAKDHFQLIISREGALLSFQINPLEGK